MVHVHENDKNVGFRMETLTKRLLSVEQLAEYIDLSPRTIYNQVARRAKRPFPLKARRVGKLVKFDLHEVDAWIDAGCPSRDEWVKQYATYG